MDAITDASLRKLQLKTDQYRTRAREAFADAAGATLDRVRDQRHAAAVSWTALADAEEARLLDRRARLLESAT